MNDEVDRYIEHPELLLGASEDVLRRLVGDRRVLERAVVHAVAIGELGTLDSHVSLSDVRPPQARDFLTWFFRHLRDKELLFSCFEKISDPLAAHRFVDLAVSFPELNRALLLDVFSDLEELVDRVGGAHVFQDHHAYAWLEYGILRRANLLLEGAPTRKFDLIELIPMAMTPLGRSLGTVFGVSRAIAGSALDGDRLSKESRALLLEVFPDDKYFEHKGSTT